MNKKWLIIAAVVVVGGLGLVGYRYIGGQRQAIAAAQEARETAVVRRDTLRVTVDATGSLAPLAEVSLAFSSSGRVTEVLVEEGQQVEAGDVLARLDDADARKAVADAELQVAQAEATLAEQQDLTTAEQAVALSEIQVTQAEINLRLAELQLAELTGEVDAAALASAHAQVTQAEIDLEDAKEALADVRAGPTEAQLAAAEAALKAAKENLDSVKAGPTEAQLAAAEAALEAAEEDYEELLARPDPEAVEQARLNLDQARNSLWSAQVSRDSTCGASARGDAPKSSCETAKASVANAEISVQLAEINYQEAQTPATAAEIASAAAAVQQAKENLEELRNSPTSAEIASADAEVQQAEENLEELRNSPTSLELTQAQNRVTEAEYKLAQAQAQLDDLLDGASTEDLESAQLNVEQARTNLTQAKLNLEADQLALETWDTTQAELSLVQAQLNLEAAQRKLEETALVAPVDGTVTELNVQPGEMASAGQAAVVVISDLSVLTVDVNLDETDVARVAVGQEARVSVDAFPDADLTGEVTYIAPVAETQSGVVLYPVTIRLAPTDIPVRAGMTADVEIVSASQEGALIIPLRAVHTEGEQAYVYRLVGDLPAQVEVTLGLMTDTEVDIISGLAEGDVVSVVATPTQGSTRQGFGPGGMFGGGD